MKPFELRTLFVLLSIFFFGIGTPRAARRLVREAGGQSHTVRFPKWKSGDFIKNLHRHLGSIRSIPGTRPDFQEPGFGEVTPDELSEFLADAHANWTDEDPSLALAALEEGLAGTLSGSEHLPSSIRSDLRTLRDQVSRWPAPERSAFFKKMNAFRRKILGPNASLRAVSMEVDLAIRSLYDGSARAPAPTVIRNLRQAQPLEFIATGTEGAVFKDQNGTAWKISLGIAQAHGIFQAREEDDRMSPGAKRRLARRWRNLRRIPSYVEPLEVLLPTRSQSGWPMKSGSLRHAHLGARLFQRFTSRKLPIPSLASSDGHVAKIPFIEGTPLKTVLREEKRDPGEMREIWKELAYWQKANERMLKETGYAIDLFSPGNLIVSGKKGSIRLTPIDFGAVRPTQEVIDWYAEQGIAIPEPADTSQMKPFEFPAVPEQILSHRKWGLSFEQAIHYIEAYHGTTDRRVAIQILAQVRKWTNPRFPGLLDPENIDRAHSIAFPSELGSEHSVALGF